MTMGQHRPEGALKAIRVSRTGRVWVDAGRLCADLAMTGPWPEFAELAARWESLRTPDDLADWITACDLGLGELEVGTTDLAQAIELRGGIWGLIRAAVQGRPRPRSAVATVNAYAANGTLVPQLAATGRRWSSPSAAQVLATIARDAVELHAHPDQLNRLRECASTDCPRVFYDTSRPGTRRWCDPVRCGDRQRARTIPTNPAPRRDRQHKELSEMAIHTQTVLDCADPHLAAGFWADALGYEREDHSALVQQLLDSDALPRRPPRSRLTAGCRFAPSRRSGTRTIPPTRSPALARAAGSSSRPFPSRRR